MMVVERELAREKKKRFQRFDPFQVITATEIEIEYEKKMVKIEGKERKTKMVCRNEKVFFAEKWGQYTK